MNRGIYTNYRTYIRTIPYEKPETKMKDFRHKVVLREKNDGDNDLYRNAAARAAEIADIDRYSQGTFDLSLLVAGRNGESYFTGTMSSPYDADYFHVDTSSQILSRRPVIVNMEMQKGADYDLTVYDDQGNQVGKAVDHGDGTKTLVIPCDWSNCRNFVIKINQHDPGENVEGTYKLTFSQGEMPRETYEWMERMKTAKIVENASKERHVLGKAVKERNDTKNAEGINALHQAQYDALPEALKYTGSLSAAELLEKRKNGVTLSEAEQAYIAIYGNQNSIYQAENAERKNRLEQEFSDFLKSIKLSDTSFEFHLTASGDVEINGLEGKQQEEVEEYIKARFHVFKNVYLSTSDETSKMTDREYQIAGYVEECSRFLKKVSGGKVSVDDLSIKREMLGQHMYKEEIAGLPEIIARSVNHAESTDPYYDYKQMMYSILEYGKIHGDIPKYHIKFNWNGQKLQ